MAASGQIGPISMAYLGKSQTFPFISFVLFIAFSYLTNFQIVKPICITQ